MDSTYHVSLWLMLLSLKQAPLLMSDSVITELRDVQLSTTTADLP